MKGRKPGFKSMIWSRRKKTLNQNRTESWKKNMAQIKDQIKAPKTELSNKKSQPIKCRVQNTGNQNAQRNG